MEKLQDFVQEISYYRDLMFNTSTDWEDRFFEFVASKYGEYGTKIAHWSLV